MTFALLLSLIAAAVGYAFAARPFWFPPAITRYGLAFDAQFSGTLWVAGAVFLLAQLALAWLALRNRNDGRRAAHSHGDLRLEALWTAATAVLFLGLALAGTRLWANMRMADEPAGALPVEVLSRQFAWSFRYPGPDGVFGRTDLKLVDDDAGNPFGIDPTDPAARDDVVSASLRVPAGRPVKLILRSRDVIHSFFVPELRLKQDLVPGMEIPLYFQADKPGVYEVPCSELCGLGHFQMRTTLRVMRPAEFERWKAEQAAR